MYNTYEPPTHRIGHYEESQAVFADNCINCNGCGTDGYGCPCRTCFGEGTQIDHEGIEAEQRELETERWTYLRELRLEAI